MTSDPDAALLRYVVLRHEGVEPPHFDLMVETAPGSPLATWRSEIWPIDRPVTLTRLPHHRREYLTYEGPVSGNRGHVRRVGGGTCRHHLVPGASLIEFGPPTVPPKLVIRELAPGEWSATPEN